MKFIWIGYLASASIFGSLGYLAGAVVASSKVGELYNRVLMAEQGLENQAALVQKLTSTLFEFITAIETNGLSNDSVNKARRLLTELK